MDDLHCRDAREWMSARLDDETADEGPWSAHVEGCAACLAWRRSVEDLAAGLRRHATPTPDVAGPAIAEWRRRTSAERGRHRQSTIGRVLLGIAGIAGLLTSGLALLDPPAGLTGAGAHAGLELLAFEAALSVGFLLAARRPDRYVLALLPVAAVVVALTLLSTATGVGTDGAYLAAELSHVAGLAGLAGLLLVRDAGVAIEAWRPAGPSRRARHS